MIERCRNPNNQDFSYYGARGILVCSEWKTFAGFFADMGEGKPGWTIERLDNNSDYSLSNCVWATRAHQSRNTHRK
jgi:hypothetical protein